MEILLSQRIITQNITDHIDLVSAMTTLTHLSMSNSSKSQDYEFTLENKHEVSVTVFYTKIKAAPSCRIPLYIFSQNCYLF